MPYILESNDNGMEKKMFRIACCRTGVIFNFNCCGSFKGVGYAAKGRRITQSRLSSGNGEGREG